MASEKQIAANRANAKRSTGPKTAAGKRRSSGNAFRHGLSGPLPDDLGTMAEFDAIVSTVIGCADAARVGADEHKDKEAAAFARSMIELRRIRTVRGGLLETLVRNNLESRGLRRLAALDRYERLARTKSRRAKRILGK
jgi:hypothetical protein